MIQSLLARTDVNLFFWNSQEFNEGHDIAVFVARVILRRRQDATEIFYYRYHVFISDRPIEIVLPSTAGGNYVARAGTRESTFPSVETGFTTTLDSVISYRCPISQVEAPFNRFNSGGNLDARSRAEWLTHMYCFEGKPWASTQLTFIDG